MISEYKHLLEQSPNPVLAALRLEQLIKQQAVSCFMQEQPEQWQHVFIHIISISNFLFHYLCRQPEVINLIGSNQSQLYAIEYIEDADSLRALKYRELLRLTALDIADNVAYEAILLALSQLAEQMIARLLTIIKSDDDTCWLSDEEFPFSILAMGKLGASELNYSSDVDLLFICANDEDINGDVNEYYNVTLKYINRLTRALEDKTAEGYLYRVDLNLRPWGKSAPLVMSIDNTEHYYEMSTEIWERFAWLRAKFVAGAQSLSTDIFERLHAYRYRGNLSTDDVERFIAIKAEMKSVRQREESWNIKLGEGGIRDIEFFVQILQMLNARRYPELQQTNTINLLASMVAANMIPAEQAEDIRHSYLFLRRLENRLQMADEAQVHDLPDDPTKRLVIARSMGFTAKDDQLTLQKFDQYLAQQRNFSKQCFDSILLNREQCQ